MAQLVKSPLAMKGNWDRSVGWVDSPGKGNGNPLQYFFSICFNCLLMDQITKIILVDTLVHPVDLVFPVASISTFYKMGGLFLHSTSWRRQFKGPQEVVCFFETFSNCIDLMNQILHADDSVFPKR